MLGEVTSTKNKPILTFDTHPFRDWGYPRGPRDALDQKLHKTKSDRRLILGGVPLKKIRIQKFWSPLASPAFQLRSLGPRAKIKIPLPMFCLPHPHVSK